MKFELNEIYTIKVANGDELVAKIVSYDDTTVTLVKPAVIVAAAEGVQLIPALFTADHEKDVLVNINQITMAVPTRGTTAENYRTAISGIQTPSKSIILG